MITVTIRKLGWQAIPGATRRLANDRVAYLKFRFVGAFSSRLYEADELLLLFFFFLSS